MIGPHRILRSKDIDEAGADVVAGDEMDELAVKAEHVREPTAAKRDGAAHDHLEYWLRIGRHGADHAANLRGGSLLLKRLFQFAAECAYLILQVGDRWGCDRYFMSPTRAPALDRLFAST